jgi:hypothetical protein
MTEPVAAHKRARNVGKKAVGVLEAFITALKDPAVSGSIDAVLAHQTRMAAERSFAGQARQVFSVVADPRALVLAEAMTTVLKRGINKRKR